MVHSITVILEDQKHHIEVCELAGKPFFCGKNVACVLGYSSDNQKKLYKLLEEEHKKPFRELSSISLTERDSQCTLPEQDEEAIYISELGLESLKGHTEIPAKVLSEIFLSIKNYTIEKLTKSLANKDQEIEKAKECAVKAEQSEKTALRRSLRLKEKTVKERIRSSNHYVYISTSKSYANQNRYKVGGVECYDNLKRRLSQYNGRSAAGDDWYFCKVRRVVNFRHFELRFWEVLHDFRDSVELTNRRKAKEMINMYYTDLERIFDLIANHYDLEIDFLNKNMRLFIDNLVIDNKIALVPDPYTLKEEKICSSDNNGPKKTREMITDEKLKEEMLKVIEGSGKKSIDRLEIFKEIEKKYRFQRRNAWTLLKSLNGSDNLKLVKINY